MSASLGYRSEIDGLRALSVMAILFFHAGFKPFSGGYVGVDIFFVISGFLITNIILQEKQKSIFSLGDFYLRRARRIFPALYFIMLACVPLAWFLMKPVELKNFSESFIAVIFFVSNFFFWQNSGYFETSAAEKPLLHTWSLGVEEQFYLIFPCFILISWQFGLKKILLLSLIIALCSLIFAQYGWYHFASANFFLLPSRAWEFFLGAMLCMLSSLQINFNLSKHLTTLLATIGLCLEVYSISFFSKSSPNPSLYTLIPTMGAVLIIAFASRTFVGTLLTQKWIIWIGRRSYSIYLWHQPLFAFLRLYNSGEPSKVQYCIAIILCFLLSEISWKFIEQPFRNPKFISTKSMIFGSMGFAMPLIAFGIVGYLFSGFESRFQIPAQVLNSFAIPERANCHDKNYAHQKDDWYCLINSKSLDDKLDFVLFGDSHALQVLSAFELAAKKANKKGLITGFSGCLPFLDTYPLIRKDQAVRNCYALNERVYSFVKKNKIKSIFLVSRWTYYTNGGYSSDLDQINFIGSKPKDSLSLENTRKAFEKGLAKTIKIYSELGVHIYIIHQIPAQEKEPQAIYYEAYSRYGNVKKFLAQSAVAYEKHKDLQGFVSSIFQHYANDSRITFINFDKILCNSNFCPIGTKNHSYYQDNNHLSKFGAKRLVQGLKKQLGLMRG